MSGMLGWEGTKRIANLTGVDPKTVRQGRKRQGRGTGLSPNRILGDLTLLGIDRGGLRSMISRVGVITEAIPWGQLGSRNAQRPMHMSTAITQLSRSRNVDHIMPRNELFGWDLWNRN